MKEEKQEEKQDFPHTPFQIKEENKKEEINTPSKISFVKNKKGRRKKEFEIPTLEEVQSYMDSLGEPLFTASHFWTYYDSREWRLGYREMKDWKKVLRNWVERDNSKNLTQKPKTTRKPAVPNNIVTFNPFKPVDTTGAVTYEEYLRIKDRQTLPRPLP